MRRFPLHLATGTGIVTPYSKSIRFVRYGCANRPFYHIVVMDTKREQRKPPIEQLGSYDPVPNVYNEKLVAFNFERIQHWIARGAQISIPVASLLGLAGFLPVHPKSYITSWRNRRTAEENAMKEQNTQEQTLASTS